MEAIRHAMILGVAGILLVVGAAQGFPSSVDSQAPSPLRAATLLPSTSLSQASTVKSQNWAGFFTHGASGSYSFVNGSWTVPSFSGTCPRNATHQDLVIWVGLDGSGNGSKTVEQSGTEMDCVHGVVSYYAWYELYPKLAIQLWYNTPNGTPWTVSPGDNVTATVVYNGGYYNLSVADLTTHRVHWYRSTYSVASRSSAEWIVERPTVGNSLGHLPNFGTVYFTNCYTVHSGKTITPSPSPGQTKAVMIDGAGNTMAMAPTGSYASGGPSFHIKWYRGS